MKLHSSTQGFATGAEHDLANAVVKSLRKLDGKLYLKYYGVPSMNGYTYISFLGSSVVAQQVDKKLFDLAPKYSVIVTKTLSMLSSGHTWRLMTR